jgi:hypothetical protein
MGQAGKAVLAFSFFPRQHGGVSVDLREEWSDLLGRRQDFADTLALYTDVFEAWARWTPPRSIALDWSEERCAASWERATPLMAEASPSLKAAEIEDVVGAGIDALARVRGDSGGLRRFAQAWDRGAISLHDLLPAKGRLGSESLESTTALGPEATGFLASTSLRPILDAYFNAVRAHLSDDLWERGVCPFCGAPPGFSDVVEDGRRRLACHLCGAGWIASRTRCPYCGTDSAQDLLRLEPEEREEGYSIAACRRCKGYLKELDRRARQNGRSALIEDWGSPHFDLVAKRAGYWRGIPSLIDVTARR